MAAYAFFPARVPFVNRDGTLTAAAIQVFQHITSLLGGTNNVLPDIVILTVQDGSAAAPGFVFDSDRDTGFYLVSEGVLGVATAGVQRVEISSNGLKVPLLTDSAFVYNGNDGYFKTATAADGQFLIGRTGDTPIIGTVSGVSGRTTVTHGPGSITVDISSGYSGQGSISTVGTITIGTWNGTVIAPAYGGTGLSSYATGDLLYASGSTALSRLPAAAAGNVLLSGTTPSWGKVSLSSHVTGNLPVTHLNGGSGASATTFWRGDGAWANPLPQGLSATSTPTFAALTVTGAFGCNGKAPQASAAVNAAITATAGGTYTATEQGMINDLKNLVNQLRSALIANGIAV